MDSEKLYEEMEHYVEPTLQKIFGDLNKFARKYDVDKEDIVQMGRIGLWDACKKYDSSKNVLFKTFGISCIRNAVFRELMHVNNYTYAKKGKNRLKSEYKINKVSLSDKINGEKDGKELTYQNLIKNNCSDCMIEEKVIGDIEFELLFERLKKILTNRECEVAILFYKDYKAAEIARILGINRQRVSQIKKKIKQKLNQLGVEA